MLKVEKRRFVQGLVVWKCPHVTIIYYLEQIFIPKHINGVLTIIL